MRLSTGLLLVAGSLLPACGLNQQGVPPNTDTLDFPSSALVDASGRWLFVVNANSDLRYNDGTLVAIDLQAAANDRGIPPIAGSTAPVFGECPKTDYTNPTSADRNYCCWDQLDRTILNCDERRYIAPQATIRIGSFGAGMAYQPACDTQSACNQPTPTCDPTALAGTGRLFIGVRGNSSLTFTNVTSSLATVPAFNCGGGTEKGLFVECDPAHEINELAIEGTNVPVPLPDEPYALALDHEKQLLYIGHLKGDSAHPDFGGVSLFDVTTGNGANGMGNPPTFIRPFGSIFPPDANGFVGVTSLTISGALGNPNELFVSSRFFARVGSMLPTNDSSSCAATTTVRSVALVQGPHTFDTTLVGTEDRGIQFIPELNRAFVLQRNPPALVGFDLAPDPLTGVLHPTDVIETCSSPTFLQAHNPGNAGARLYVTCFETGQVYVVDPAVPRVVEAIEVGRGPAGLAFGPIPSQANLATYSQDRDDYFTTRGYVVGFGDNDISVVDLDPMSLTQNHVIQRIGFPNTEPR